MSEIASSVLATPRSDGRERRESERAIAYWERKTAELGDTPTIAALDLGAIGTEDWSYRFVIAVDPDIGNSSLLLYGAAFARLLDLPARSAVHLPMSRQLPRRFAEIFNHGCGEAHALRAPVRLEGEVEREDGRVERYRAAFIPVGVKPDSLTHLAFGAFNSRVN